MIDSQQVEILGRRAIWAMASGSTLVTGTQITFVDHRQFRYNGPRS